MFHVSCNVFTTPSILLRSRDVGEADRLYTFYTRDYGKVEALATGVRKVKSKLAGHLVPHAIIQCTFFRGRRDMRLVQARSERHYTFPLDPLTSFAVAAYAREAIDALVKPGIADAVPFDLFVRLYAGLAARKTAPHLLLHAFFFRLLENLGYRPPSRLISSRDVVPTFLNDHLAIPLHSERFLVYSRDAQQRGA